ncbi:Protein aq_1857 [Zea mays]|nr:Protein aq_1857 [Zea mays]
MASSLSRALLRRVAELARGRLRANHRMLSSASSTAAIERASQLPAEAQAVRMTEGCVRRLKELHAKKPSAEGKMLRLSVEAGGCSGFQYSFALDDKKNADDR